MPFCTKCGQEYTEGDKFCTHCGNSLQNNNSQRPTKPVSLNSLNNQVQTNGNDDSTGLIIGILSLVFSLSGFLTLVGFILGIVGLSKNRTNKVGRGLSLAGLIIGILSIIGTIIYIVLLVCFAPLWILYK